MALTPLWRENKGFLEGFESLWGADADNELAQLALIQCLGPSASEDMTYDINNKGLTILKLASLQFVRWNLN